MTTDFRYDGTPELFLWGVKCILIRRLECCEKRLAGSSFWYIRLPVSMEPPGFHQADGDILLSGAVTSTIYCWVGQLHRQYTVEWGSYIDNILLSGAVTSAIYCWLGQLHRQYTVEWGSYIDNIQVWLKSRESKRHSLHDPHNFTLSI
jgi:hypothetical protein